MEDLIGTIFQKPLQEDYIKVPDADGKETGEVKENDAPNTFRKYAKAADWCNTTQMAYIEDKGDYFEVVAIPEPTEEEKAAQKLSQAKAERADAVSKITVEVDGMVFDGDEEAQTRMGRTVAAAVAQGADLDTTYRTWVLADNTVAQVTVAQLAEALTLAGDAQTALWTKPYETETDSTEEE